MKLYMRLKGYSIFMHEINKDIGQRILTARKNKKMSAVELSKLTGFSSARISHWEQGKRMPNIESILIISEVLDAPASYLMALDDIKVNSTKNQHGIPIVDFNNVSNFKYLAFIKIEENANDSLFATSLIDDSMEPPFRKEDIVVFEKKNIAQNGDLLLLEIKKTKQVLFRKYIIDYLDIDNPEHQLKAFNEKFPIIIINDMQQISVIGVYRNKQRLFL